MNELEEEEREYQEKQKILQNTLHDWQDLLREEEESSIPDTHRRHLIAIYYENQITQNDYPIGNTGVIALSPVTCQRLELEVGAPVIFGVEPRHTYSVEVLMNTKKIIENFLKAKYRKTMLENAGSTYLRERQRFPPEGILVGLYSLSKAGLPGYKTTYGYFQALLHFTGEFLTVDWESVACQAQIQGCKKGDAWKYYERKLAQPIQDQLPMSVIHLPFPLQTDQGSRAFKVSISLDTLMKWQPDSPYKTQLAIYSQLLGKDLARVYTERLQQKEVLLKWKDQVAPRRSFQTLASVYQREKEREQTRIEVTFNLEKISELLNDLPSHILKECLYKQWKTRQAREYLASYYPGKEGKELSMDLWIHIRIALLIDTLEKDTRTILQAYLQTVPHLDAEEKCRMVERGAEVSKQ